MNAEIIVTRCLSTHVGYAHAFPDQFLRELLEREDVDGAGPAEFLLGCGSVLLR